MNEDVVHFIQPGERDDREQAPELPRHPGWHLNDDDLSVIDALHATCAEWLAFAKDGKRARIVAAAMEALEAIAGGRNVESMIEIEVSKKPKGGDGLSVTLQLSNDMIELSSTEWAWMSPEQGHDHAWTLHAELSPRGGFAQEDADHWFFLCGFTTDEDQANLVASQTLGRDSVDAD